MKFFLLLARFSLTCWLGAAVMFVLLTVIEILSGQFESVVLDRLVLTRFPVYYAVTFILQGIAIAAGIVCCLMLRSTRLIVFAALVGVSLLILLGDYFFVYLKLENMLLPLGSPRPQEFVFYHRLTESLNCLALLISCIAAAIINWTVPLPDKKTAD